MTLDKAPALIPTWLHPHSLPFLLLGALCLAGIAVDVVRYPQHMAIMNGTPQGASLAAMTLSQRPNIKVLFTALPEYTAYLEGMGAFLVLPVTIPDLVGAVDQLLRP